MRSSRLLLGLSTTVVAGLLVAPATAPAVYYPGLRYYKATLDLAGRIVISRHVDSTRECTPGRAYTQVSTIDVEMGRARPIQVTISPRVIGTTTARTNGLGEAKTDVAIEDFKTTSGCAPNPPATPQEPGPCGSVEGDISAALVGSYKDGKTPVYVQIYRRNGNQLRFSDGCEPMEAGALDSKNRPLPGVGLTQMPVPGTGMIAPLGITATTLRKLGRGEAVARKISFSGPCENVDVQTARARTVGPDGQLMRNWCKVKGSLWVRLKRTS